MKVENLKVNLVVEEDYVGATIADTSSGIPVGCGFAIPKWKKGDSFQSWCLRGLELQSDLINRVNEQAAQEIEKEAEKRGASRKRETPKRDRWGRFVKSTKNTGPRQDPLTGRFAPYY